MRTTHAARVSTLLAIVGVLAPMPRGSLAQPGGGSGGGSGGGGPPETDDDGTSVLCEEDGTSAHYEEFFEGEESTMVRWGGSDTGCPNHVNWDLNPNDAKENPSNMSIPAYPMMFEDEGTTDLSSTPNAVGIMRNGVTMFSSWALNTVVEYEDTAFYLEADTLDLCGGHSTIEGTYHYHSVAGCLQEQAMVNDGTSADGHSAILGWAYDGFPIYGQLGPNGVEMKMCDLDGADAEACLDVCSGYEALLPTVDDFTYRYYTSCGFDESFFPFTTNCFRGCCPDGVTCSEKVEACGDNPEVGYTDDYEPFLTENLTVQYDADLVEGDDTDFIDSEYTVNCSLYMGAGSTLSVTGTTPSPAGGTVVGGTPSPASDGSTPEPSSATGTNEEDEINAAAHSVPALVLAAGSWAVAAAAALFIL